MDEPDDEAINVVDGGGWELTRGAIISIGFVLLMATVVGYLLFSPLELLNRDGFNIGCGSAALPTADSLAKIACGDWALQRRWQAGSVAVGGVVVLMTGVAAFGRSRRLPD